MQEGSLEQVGAESLAEEEAKIDVEVGESGGAARGEEAVEAKGGDIGLGEGEVAKSWSGGLGEESGHAIADGGVASEVEARELVEEPGIDEGVNRGAFDAVGTEIEADEAFEEAGSEERGEGSIAEEGADEEGMLAGAGEVEAFDTLEPGTVGESGKFLGLGEESDAADGHVGEQLVAVGEEGVGPEGDVFDAAAPPAPLEGEVGDATGPFGIVASEEVVGAVGSGIGVGGVGGESCSLELGADEGGARFLAVVFEPVGPGQSMQIVVGVFPDGFQKRPVMIHRSPLEQADLLAEAAQQRGANFGTERIVDEVECIGRDFLGRAGESVAAGVADAVEAEVDSEELGEEGRACDQGSALVADEGATEVEPGELVELGRSGQMVESGGIEGVEGEFERFEAVDGGMLNEFGESFGGEAGVPEGEGLQLSEQGEIDEERDDAVAVAYAVEGQVAKLGESRGAEEDFEGVASGGGGVEFEGGEGIENGGLGQDVDAGGREGVLGEVEGIEAGELGEMEKGEAGRLVEVVVVEIEDADPSEEGTEEVGGAVFLEESGEVVDVAEVEAANGRTAEEFCAVGEKLFDIEGDFLDEAAMEATAEREECEGAEPGDFVASEEFGLAAEEGLDTTVGRMESGTENLGANEVGAVEVALIFEPVGEDKSGGVVIGRFENGVEESAGLIHGCNSFAESGHCSEGEGEEE